jgi:hypothetical protein
MNATVNTAKTIAEYSADPSNPWHAWIVDNAQEYRAFILLAQKLVRLQLDNRGPGVFNGVEQYFAENPQVNRDEAIDAWVAYEEFKSELIEYRDAK